MATGFQESTSGLSASFTSSGGNNDAGDFECNICFDLAQDPIITLCGHLFCWPCLYKWLHHHSQSQECPVCKALIQEEKLVPLYGRGKNTTDPRSRPVPDADIPRRPAGQRPETASPRPPQHAHAPPEANYVSNIGFGLLGGFIPMATARFGNMTMSAGFGGWFPSMLNFQLQGFPDAAVYGGTHGFPFEYGQGFHAGGGHGVHNPGYQRSEQTQVQGHDSMLKNLLMLVGFIVLLTLLWS